MALPLYTWPLNMSGGTSVVALGGSGVVILSLLASAALVRRPTGGNITFNIVVAGAAAWFVGDSVRARRAYVAGLTQQAEERQRREMERAQQSIVEERLQIARELHDIVAHSLSVIAIQSGVGRHVLDTAARRGPEGARGGGADQPLGP